jgi:putative ABC transport system permease protein
VFVVDPEILPPGARAPGQAAIGAALAQRLGFPEAVTVAGRRVAVGAVLPSTASAEDLGGFLSQASAREVVGAAGRNELRVYLRVGVDPADAEARLRAASGVVGIIRTDRGAVADRDTQRSLAQHRTAAHLVLALVAAVTLLIAAHLDAAERRTEIATLVAIGARRRTIVSALVLRSVAVACAGALAGIAAAPFIARAGEATAGVAEGFAGTALLSVVTAVLVGVAAAAPTATVAARRDPVPTLQDG